MTVKEIQNNNELTNFGNRFSEIYRNSCGNYIQNDQTLFNTIKKINNKYKFIPIPLFDLKKAKKSNIGNTIRIKYNRNFTNKLFGRKFIEKNKHKFAIIYNNKQNIFIEKTTIEGKNDKNFIRIILKLFSYFTNISDMFSGCSCLSYNSELFNLDTSRVKSMNNLFFGCSCLS